MALPTSGNISIQSILKEMGQATSKTVSLDSLASQWYARTGKSKFNGAIHRLSDWYGESWAYANKQIIGTI